MHPSGPSGITHRFQWLSQSVGYVGYVLLTLSPLYSPEGFRARLACLIHTASVHSEPGSNPSNWCLFGYLEICVCAAFTTQTLRSPLSFQEPPLFSKIDAHASRRRPPVSQVPGPRSPSRGGLRGPDHHPSGGCRPLQVGGSCAARFAASGEERYVSRRQDQPSARESGAICDEDHLNRPGTDT